MYDNCHISDKSNWIKVKIKIRNFIEEIAKLHEMTYEQGMFRDDKPSYTKIKYFSEESRLYKLTKHLRRYRTKMGMRFPGRWLVESFCIFVPTNNLCSVFSSERKYRDSQPISDWETSFPFSFWRTIFVILFRSGLFRSLIQTGFTQITDST